MIFIHQGVYVTCYDCRLVITLTIFITYVSKKMNISYFICSSCMYISIFMCLYYLYCFSTYGGSLGTSECGVFMISTYNQIIYNLLASMHTQTCMIEQYNSACSFMVLSKVRNLYLS